MYSYKEIIPENRKSRELCKYLNSNYNVRFPEKIMTEKAATDMFRMISKGRHSKNKEGYLISLYFIDESRWYDDKYKEKI